MTEPITGRFDAPALAALNALASVRVTHTRLIEALPDVLLTPDDRTMRNISRATPELRALEPLQRKLASVLLRYVIGDTSALASELTALCDDIAQRTQALSSALRIDLTTAAPPPGDLGFEYCATELREAGLEELDLEVELGVDGDGALVIFAGRISPEAAHVWLLEPAFRHAEVFAAADALLDLERQAAGWWFRCWTPAPGRQEDENEFSRGVREQEWSLVDRQTLALDASVIGALCDTPEIMDAMPPRQQRMTRALRRSFASAFTVESVVGQTTTLRDLISGREHVVHEHMTPPRYAPGYLAMGRIIPFESGHYLRSPGMAFLAPYGDDLSGIVTRGLAAAGDFPVALRIESVLSIAVSRAKLPRAVKPAASPTAARALLDELTEELDAADLRRPMAESDLPDEIRRTIREPLQDLHGYAVDEPVARWLSALGDQAGSRARGGTGRKRGSAKRGSAKRGKKKR